MLPLTSDPRWLAYLDVRSTLTVEEAAVMQNDILSIRSQEATLMERCSRPVRQLADWQEPDE